MSLLKNTRLQTKLIVSFILSSLMTLGVGVFDPPPEKYAIEKLVFLT